MKPVIPLSIALLIAAAPAVLAQDHAAHEHGRPIAGTRPAATPDTRQPVRLPKTLRDETLANMRDHLAALQEIQQALAQEDYDRAADVAEQRLGMSSLSRHGAHEVAKYMPAGMREAGGAMHRNASRLAVASRDVGATGDPRPALAALANVTAQCVACHAGYRVKQSP